MDTDTTQMRSPDSGEAPSNAGLAYRPDIDGVRAIAVVAVVLFHLQFQSFRGGYVGVDVFFVLSGFLISGLIYPKAVSGEFSFSSFYLRRIRRLVPPLVVTIAVTALFAAFILLPDDMAAFARSAIAALASLSNIVFFLESGYWDTISELKPLLHTWSLGVEEQFYLFWPALIVAIAAMRRRSRAAIALTVISLIGFAVAVWMNQVDQAAAFYLLPFRVFQFSLGALIGFIPVSKLRSIASPVVRDIGLVVGLGLIMLAVIGYTDATPFPGWYALPPTIGTMVLLLAGSQPHGPGPVGHALLENPVSVWLGKASYSMYLVHWPLIALYRYATGLDLTWHEQLALASATVVGTVLLHHGVERRFYVRGASVARAPRTPPGRFARRTLAASAVLALVFTTAWHGDGWSWRYPELSLTPDDIAAGVEARFDLTREGCRVGNLESAACDAARPTQVLVLGDSHEPDGYNILAGGYGDDQSVNLIAFGTVNQCEDLRVFQDRWVTASEECQTRLDNLFDEALVSTLDVVVYSANRPFDDNKTALIGLLDTLRARAPELEIVTIGGYINTSVPCSRLVNETGSTKACAAPENVIYFESDPNAYPLSDEVMRITDQYVDLVGELCDGRLLSRCRTKASTGEPVFYDQHHLSLPFALEVGEEYAMEHPDLLET